MSKLFPKSRVCVIDCYPSFKNGVTAASSFAKENNISLNTQDGARLILGYCLKFLEQEYQQTKSIYPKVLFLSKIKSTNKFKKFLESHFDKLMKHVPYPYCGEFDLNSPDLETAAESSLKKQKTQKKFKEFLKTKLKLKEVKS